MADWKALFEALYESDTLLVVAVDAEGRIALFNPASEKASGYGREEVLGKRIVDFPIPESIREEARALLQDVKAGKPVPPLTYLVHTREGKGMLVSWSVCPVTGPGGDPQLFLAIGQNTIERGGATERLALSEERFRLLIENALDLVTVIKADGTIGYVGPSVERLLGYGREELAGKKLLDFVHPDEAEAAEAALRFAMGRPGVTGDFEVRVRHKDGSWRTHEATASNLLDNPVIEGLVINSRDVTERKRMEQELTARTEEMEHLFQLLPDLYFRLRQDGTILDCKAGKAEDLYVPPREFMGRKVQDVLPPEVGERIRRFLREMGEAGSPTHLEYALPMPQGTQWYEARMVPAFQDQLIVLVRNISERVKSESLLREQRDLALELGGANDVEEVLRSTLRAVMRAGGLECGAAYMVAPNSGALEPVCSEGFSEAYVASPRRRGLIAERMKLKGQGGTQAGAVGERILLQGGDELREGLKTTSLLPVAHGEEVVGCIEAASREEVSIPEQVWDALEVMAGQAGQAAARIRLVSAMRESEEKYRLLYEHAGETIFSYGPDLRLLNFNRAAEAFLGYREEELVGRDILELGLLHPDDIPVAAHNLERLKAGEESVTDEYRMLRKSGEMVTAELTGSVLRDSSGALKAVIIVGHDVTRRKEKEKFNRIQRDLAVRLSGVADTEEAMDFSLRALLEATELDGGGIYLVDQATGEFAETCGKSPCIPASRIAEYLEGKAVAEGGLHGGEAIRLGSGDEDAAVRPMLAEAGVRSMLLAPIVYEDRVIACAHVVSRDKDEIPERKRGQFKALVDQVGEAVSRSLLISALRSREEIYRVTFESTGTAMIIIGLDGTILDGNQEVQKLAGYTREEVAGKRKYMEFIHPDDLWVATQNSLRLLSGEISGPVQYEARVFHGDGRILDTIIHVSVLPGMGKSVASIIDITEKREYERELEKRAEQLRDFLDVAAHELRHPATLIKGYALTLKEYGSRMGEEERLGALEAIARSVDQLTDVVEDLLDLSRIERGALVLERERRELLPLVYRAVEEMMVRGKGARIEVDMEPGLDKMLVDARKFLRLMVILLDNAIKYSPPDSTIEVKGEIGEGEALISVMDRGRGVREEDKDKVFDRFYQAESARHHASPGLGLGLYIARRIVEAHGGRIWYEPREGGGSVFRFTLPL